MKKILVYDSGQAFTLTSLSHQPLGGSEISILLLSKGLAQLGHSVALLNNSQVGVESLGRIQLDHVNNFDAYAEICDIILFNRVPAPTIKHWMGKKPMYIWCHDAYDQQNCRWMANLDPSQMFEKMFFVSEWQQKTIGGYLNLDLTHTEVLPNCIDPQHNFNMSVEKQPGRLIFASVPYKGIEVLKDIFDCVCIKSSRDDLELHVFSSFGLYSQKEGDEQYKVAFSDLFKTANVTLHESVSNLEINKEFARSDLLIHPSTYHETFGRVSIEAMMNGCIPVAVNNGANLEVIGNRGYMVPGCNIYDSNTFDAFVDTIISALVENKEKQMKRDQGKIYSMAFDYVRVAKRFLEKIGE